MDTNCPNCGAPVSLDSNCCPYCGTPYRTESRDEKTSCVFYMDYGEAIDNCPMSPMSMKMLEAEVIEDNKRLIDQLKRPLNIF